MAGSPSVFQDWVHQQLQAATYRVKHDFWALRSKTPPPGAANPAHQQHAGQDLGEPDIAGVQPSVIVQQRSARRASAAVDGHAEVEDPGVLDGEAAAMDLGLGESDEQGTADEDMDDGMDSGNEDLVEGTAHQEQGLQQVHRNPAQPLQELDGEEGNSRLLAGTAAGSTGGGSGDLPRAQGKGAEPAGVRHGDTALGRQPSNGAPARHMHSVSAGGTIIEPCQPGLGVLASRSAAKTAPSTAVDTSASDVGSQPSLMAEPAYSPTGAPGTAAEPGTGGSQVWREERTLHQVQQSPAGYRQHGLQPVGNPRAHPQASVERLQLVSPQDRQALDAACNASRLKARSQLQAAGFCRCFQRHLSLPVLPARDTSVGPGALSGSLLSLQPAGGSTPRFLSAADGIGSSVGTSTDGSSAAVGIPQHAPGAEAAVRLQKQAGHFSSVGHLVSALKGTTVDIAAGLRGRGGGSSAGSNSASWAPQVCASCWASCSQLPQQQQQQQQQPGYQAAHQVSGCAAGGLAADVVLSEAALAALAQLAAPALAPGWTLPLRVCSRAQGPTGQAGAGTGPSSTVVVAGPLLLDRQDSQWHEFRHACLACVQQRLLGHGGSDAGAQAPQQQLDGPGSSSHNSHELWDVGGHTVLLCRDSSRVHTVGLQQPRAESACNDSHPALAVLHVVPSTGRFSGRPSASLSDLTARWVACLMPPSRRWPAEPAPAQSSVIQLAEVHVHSCTCQVTALQTLDAQSAAALSSEQGFQFETANAIVSATLQLVHGLQPGDYIMAHTAGHNDVTVWAGSSHFGVLGSAGMTPSPELLDLEQLLHM